MSSRLQRTPAAAMPVLVTVLAGGFLLCYTAGQRGALLVPLAMALGGVLAGLVVLQGLRNGFPVVPELGLLAGFIAWAVGTGLVMELDHALFRDGIERLVQVFLLAAVLATLGAMLRTPAIGMGSVTLLALVLAGVGMATGDFGEAAEMTQRGARVVGTRAASLTSNPNSLGVLSALGFAGLAFAWWRSRRWSWRLLLLAAAVPLLLGAVLSGSRKALLLIPVFLFAWAWFCYRQVMFRRARVLAAWVAVAAGFGLAGWYVYEHSFAGYRLQRAMSEQQDTSSAARLEMIEEGLQFVAANPVAGVGLYQFVAVSAFEKYSHNDYIEVAATTGLVGFALYYSLFGVTIWRLARVRRRASDPELRYLAGLCLAVLVTCAAAGFAQVQFSSIAFWCLVAPIIGFACSAARRVPQTRPQPARRPQPSPPPRRVAEAGVQR